MGDYETRLEKQSGDASLWNQETVAKTKEKEGPRL